MSKNTFTMAYSLLLLSIIVLLLCISSCILLDCGDFYSLSPEELLKTNDYVLLGDFVLIDTLANLGALNYLGSESKFTIVEYTFQPTINFKGEKQHKIYLWNCEREEIKDNYSTVEILDKSETYLVYGKKISQFYDVINVMTPITFIEDLKSLLEGGKPSRDEAGWNTMHADSVIASRMLRNDQLKSILDQRNLNGQVIFGTDQHLATFVQFRQGSLCYYDTADKARNVNREEYIEKLRSLSLSLR